MSDGKMKENAIKESMSSPKVIDLSIDFSIPRVNSSLAFNEKKHKVKCSCCGKGFSTYKNYFQKSNSPLFQANDGYLPWCKLCTDKYVDLLVALYNRNEEHAIEHFCQQVDWVYDIEPLKSAREISADRSRISHYAAKKNLNVGNRKTYIDSLKFAFETKGEEIITSREQAKSEDSMVSASAIDRWGIGFKDYEYKNLDEHYRMLKKYNPNADSNQEIFIKDLCNINMLKIRALQSGDSKEYASLVAQYSKTFKDAGLKTIQEVDNSAEQPLGVTLATISKYTPEEYYKNKQLYKDADGIGDYITRFLFRPLANLMTGTNVRDTEYYVKEDDDGTDEN